MSEELICPDCGGVIGEPPGGDVKACTCSVEAYHPSDKAVRAAENSNAAARVEAAKEQKLCRVCGKNVAGHRRLKDSRGYMCLACAKAEEEAADAGLVSCGECGRKLKPAGLVDYHGTHICKKCYADHQENSKFKAPPPNLNMHNQYEKQSIKTLLIIGGVLLVIIVFASFKWFSK